MQRDPFEEAPAAAAKQDKRACVQQQIALTGAAQIRRSSIGFMYIKYKQLPLSDVGYTSLPLCSKVVPFL
jgi:hypothetical protein